jgi:DNA-binding transcriptional ArsR family regulator
VGDVYQALADLTRRKILDELTERDGQTLFEICSRLAMKHGLMSSRQAVSHHLDRRPLEHIADRWLKPDPNRRSDENQPD